jgi:hypothetical protein
MPYSRAVNSPSGFNYQADAAYVDVVVQLASGAVCTTGQVLCRDVTNIPSATAADQCVLPTSANAGPVMGAYQGPAITNSTGATATYTIQLQVGGWGSVFAGTNATPTRVTVGSNLVVTSSNLYATVGAYAVNTEIGVALATGTNTAVGANLTGASSGNTAVVNCYINCR